MSRFAIMLVLLAACGDLEPEGPGRAPPPAGPICQWKTPCQPAEAPIIRYAVDGGVADGEAP
jgi:hypothetical protein